MSSQLSAKRRRTAVAFVTTPTTRLNAPTSFRPSLSPLQPSSTYKTHLQQKPTLPTIFCTHKPRQSSSSDKDPEDADDDNMKLHPRNARRRNPGDLLPFDVSVSTPPPQYLGRFQLDPRTHNGDVVEYDGRHFVVKQVTLKYRYTRGKYRVVGKAIEVKSLARKSIEAYLERTLKES